MHNGGGITRQDGYAAPLCACGECFKVCDNFQELYAVACQYNSNPKCEMCQVYVARRGGYCTICAGEVGATQAAKAAQELRARRS